VDILRVFNTSQKDPCNTFHHDLRTSPSTWIVG
jgi:hypothetical protein